LAFDFGVASVCAMQRVVVARNAATTRGSLFLIVSVLSIGRLSNRHWSLGHRPVEA
jgi:hypothetical protein